MKSSNQYNIVSDHNSGYSIVKRDSKWGCIDINGNTIIPFEFDEIKEFENGFISARKSCEIIMDDYWGTFGRNGDIIAENEVELINGLFKGQHFMLYGIRTIDFKVIIPYDYDEIVFFYHDSFKVRKNEEWGIINSNGTITLPVEYMEIGDLIDGKARIYKKEKYIFRRGKNEEIKYGYINENAELIIPLCYSYIDLFRNGKARAKKGRNWGVINEQGKTIIPFEYSGIQAVEDSIIIAKIGKKWGCINLENNILTPFQYDAISYFANGKAKVRIGSGIESNILNGKKNINYFNYVDLNGKIIFPFYLSRIGKFVDGKAIAIINDEKGQEKYGCIDEKGNTIIQFEYDGLSYFNNGTAIALLDTIYFRIDENKNNTPLNENEKVIYEFVSIEESESDAPDYLNMIPCWLIFENENICFNYNFILEEWGAYSLEIKEFFGDELYS